jgi:hypothetical protein
MNVVNVTQAKGPLTMEQQTSSQVSAADFIKAVHGVRYQVKDVARAVTFYTQRLAEAPTTSGVCQRLVGRRGCPSERSRSIRIAADAEW